MPNRAKLKTDGPAVTPEVPPPLPQTHTGPVADRMAADESGPSAGPATTVSPPGSPPPEG